jgi:hypothetical protein
MAIQFCKFQETLLLLPVKIITPCIYTEATSYLNRFFLINVNCCAFLKRRLIGVC